MKFTVLLLTMLATCVFSDQKSFANQKNANFPLPENIEENHVEIIDTQKVIVFKNNDYNQEQLNRLRQIGFWLINSSSNNIRQLLENYASRHACAVEAMRYDINLGAPYHDRQVSVNAPYIITFFR